MALLAALRLEDGAYAITIRQELEERAGRKVARGALYTVLERLESKGYVASRSSDPRPERGGRFCRCGLRGDQEVRRPDRGPGVRAVHQLRHVAAGGRATGRLLP